VPHWGYSIDGIQEKRLAEYGELEIVWFEKSIRTDDIQNIFRGQLQNT